MGLRDWAWRKLSAHGRALDAYERGLATHQVTLEVLTPEYKRTLEEIASVGWRLNDQFEHPRVKLTDVTPKSDGGHEVVRTESQKTTFYFVREANRPVPAVEQVQSSAHWPAGWYETQQGLCWWDGAQWTQFYSPTRWPYQQASDGTSNTGMSSREHVLHFVMTLLTCGVWAPAWVLLARRRKHAR